MTVDNTASGRYSGYMYNNAALYVSGAMALSQSAYISWGPWGMNDSTEVGFTTNKNGTLMFKDNPTGSWTELGNTRDNTILGDASGDTVTINASTVAIPNDLNFDSNTLVLDASNNRVGVGVASPAVPLHVKANVPEFRLEDADAGGYAGVQSSDGNLEFYADDGNTRLNSNIVFQVDNSEKVRITDGGKVGIGVADPDSGLEVLNTSTQQKWSYDSDSFATMTVADNSNTTLAVGETGTFTLDVAGNVALSADGGNITMDDGTTTVFDFDVDDPTLKIMDDADTGDYFSINVAANGATTITTVDDDAAAANLQITADGTCAVAATTITLDSSGDVVLDADGDQVSMKFGGATGQIDFSNTNSGDGIIRQMIDSKDLIIQQYDGTEVCRFTDGLDVKLADDLLLTSDSSAISLGDAADVTITHDGTAGVTIAANPITLDSAGDIILDAAGDDIYFKENGTTRASLGVASTGDLLFKDADGTEIFRIDGSADSLLMATSKKIEFSDGLEYIYSDGADLQLSSGRDIILTSNSGNGNVLITGSLNVSGTINAYKFETIVHNSTTYQGDNTFGNDSGDVSTFTSQLTASEGINIPDNERLSLGTGAQNDMYLQNNGTTGSLSSSLAFEINMADDTEVAFTIKDSAATYFSIDTRNSENSQGGNVTLSTGIGGDLNLDANGTNLYFKGGGTTRGMLGLGETGDLVFKAATATEIFRIDGSANSLLMASSKKIEFEDSDKYIQSDGTDLKLGSDSDINLVATTDVLLDAGGDIVLDADGSTVYFKDAGTVYARLSSDQGFTVNGALAASGSATLGDSAADVITATGQLTASEGLTSTGDAFFNSDVTLGNAAADIATVTAQLTASEGLTSTGDAFFNSDVTLGNAAADIITSTGQLTASVGATIAAHKKLRVGADEEYLSGNGTDLSIVSGGDIILDAAASSILFKEAGTTFASITEDGDDAYINFGTTAGSSGYGIVDDAGTLKFKNSGGSWTAFGTGGASGMDDLTDVTYSSGDLTISSLDTIIASGNLTFDVGGDIILDPAGNDVLPPSDNTTNLGSASKRWANVYTGDLHLKNDRGDWTILEEENYICVVNNKTNKRYKMMLEEIKD